MAEKELSLFLNKHVNSENINMFCGMHIILVIGKLAENATMNRFSLFGIRTNNTINPISLLA